MQKRDLTRLVRILGLLSSDNAGERASAAKAAHDFIKKHDLDWNDLLTANSADTGRRKTKEIGIDYLEAAESRIRQLQTHNQRLEKQVQRLKDRLDGLD